MKNYFLSCFEKTLLHEGGYANHADDPGGETYCGISRRYHSDWAGWRIIDDITNKKNYQIFNHFTLKHLVQNFYLVKIWEKYKLMYIQNEALVNNIFDWLVNSAAAPKKIQEIVEVELDGIFGKITLNAINKSETKKLNNSIVAARIEYYKSLNSLSPNWKRIIIKRAKTYSIQNF